MHFSVILVLTLLAGVAGFFSAITGGSGMIMLPSLLVTGLLPQVALGTNKVFTTSGLMLASYSFFKKKIYHPRFWLVAAITTIIGSFFGAELIQLLPIELIQITVPVIIIAAAIYFYFSKKINYHYETNAAEQKPNIKRRLQQIAVGSCLGIYSGSVGAATGTVWTACLMRIFKVQLLEAIALSRFMCLLSNVTALITFAYLHEVDYKVGLLIAIGGVIGSRIGVSVTVKISANAIRLILITVTVLMAIIYIYENFYQHLIYTQSV